MKFLFPLITSIIGAGAFQFGSYECANNCHVSQKYGRLIGPAQVKKMTDVRVFGAYYGNLF